MSPVLHTCGLKLYADSIYRHISRYMPLYPVISRCMPRCFLGTGVGTEVWAVRIQTVDFLEGISICGCGRHLSAKAIGKQSGDMKETSRLVRICTFLVLSSFLTLTFHHHQLLASLVFCALLEKMLAYDWTTTRTPSHFSYLISLLEV